MPGLNYSGQFTADISQFIADETLSVAQRTIVLHQIGEPADLPEGQGTVYTATRFNRLPLPAAPLAEGVPPVGETLTISQVTGTCLQWGDSVQITDVAELTTKHPVMKKANELVALQITETLERNDFNALMGATQVNYVNSRGSRASLLAGDTLDAHTINRSVAALETLGAYKYMGPEETDVKLAAGKQAEKAYRSPGGEPHYVMIVHTLVAGDFSENQAFVQASTYSNVNALYNSEAGYWRGARICKSNMVPFWTGFAAVQGTAVPTGGSFTSGSYFVQITGQDNQNQYESYIAQVSNSITVAANGSVTVTTPSTSGYTYNIYVGTTASPTNLALSSSGPTSGPLAGQATQLPPSTLVTITGTGIFQVPPAAPTTGITVYSSFLLGKGYFSVVKLSDVKITWLDKADKSDKLNQLRIIGWKLFNGVMISNQLYGCRIESTSAFTSTFT